MSKLFEELDCQRTPIGEISLRRRKLLQLDGKEILEVKLGEEYLMSSLFHTVEVALADIGISKLWGREELKIVVGGLGLGYTAAAALEHPNVSSLLVVEFLDAVVGWHERGLIPLGATLVEDKRCEFVLADFFKLAASPELNFDQKDLSKKFDGILLDIDHSPKKLLNARNAEFYTDSSLAQLATKLTDKGVFAMWSDDPPEEEFMQLLKRHFSTCEAQIVEFENPLQNCTSASTVYVCVL